MDKLCPLEFLTRILNRSQVFQYLEVLKSYQMHVLSFQRVSNFKQHTACKQLLKYCFVKLKCRLCWTRDNTYHKPHTDFQFHGLWNPEVHSRINKDSQIIPNQNPNNKIFQIHTYFFRYLFQILSSLLHLHLYRDICHMCR